MAREARQFQECLSMQSPSLISELECVPRASSRIGTDGAREQDRAVRMVMLAYGLKTLKELWKRWDGEVDPRGVELQFCNRKGGDEFNEFGSSIDRESRAKVS